MKNLTLHAIASYGFQQSKNKYCLIMLLKYRGGKTNEIIMDPEVAQKAKNCLDNMLKLSQEVYL